jgi:hypothetical protein
MPMRTGSADLPLHTGHVPLWLAQRMASLGRVIIEAIAHHYGRDEVLRRLAHPFWFQSFGAVMGMDWHSSGITTSVMGALKRGLRPLESELGLYVCGGRGRHSRRTPAELALVGDRTGLDAAPLARASRLVAKVDSAALQDGYALYLHSFVVSVDGRWCVVQQGMNPMSRTARRYHWLSERVTSFVDSPHQAIEGPAHGTIVNLADVRAARSRAASLELVRAGPERTLGVLRRSRDATQMNLDLFAGLPAPCEDAPVSAPHAASHPHLQMPAHHDVRVSDVVLKRLQGTLIAAAEAGPRDFEELLLLPGVGERTVASLAFVAEIVHGTVARFSDPARFSLAHGGKDGHPFPVPLHVYDQTICVLKDALKRARLGNRERLDALQRLDQQARLLERVSRGPALAAHLATEREATARYGGRTVFRRSPRRH